MQLIDNVARRANRLACTNPITNVYGVARALLAFGTFSTLLVNNTNVLFPRLVGNPLFATDKIKQFSIFQICGPDHLEIARLLCLLGLLLVLSGFLPRLTGLLHWWITWSVWLSIPIIDGGDQIASNIALLLLPVTFCDDRRWHWSEHDSTCMQPTSTGKKVLSLLVHTCYWLIQVQVSFLYLNSAFAKLKVTEWVDGTAVYYWFTHDVFGVPTFLKAYLIAVLAQPLVVVLVTWSVLLLELLLAGAILMRNRNKWILFKFGLFFHLLIIVVHGLFSFFFSMAGGLLLYLRPVSHRFRFHTISHLGQEFALITEPKIKKSQ